MSKQKEIEKQEFEIKKPEYTNNGVAVWINKGSDGSEYLTIKIVGHNTITAFKSDNNQKPKKE